MLGDDPTHDLLVDSALHALAGADDFRAVDRRGLVTPEPLCGFRPDVTAAQQGVPIVAAAFTADELSDPDLPAKLRAFWPRQISDDGERSALHLFVPRGQRDRLRELIAAAGLDPDDYKVAIHTVGLPDRQ